jgi:hypothetical protein
MKLDVKTLVIGVLLGICVTLTMGQRRAEPAQKLDADYRYQISATVHIDNGQPVHTLYILDHEKNKVHATSAPHHTLPLDIKQTPAR